MASTPGFLSVRDPENFAVRVDGAWFRVASPESAAALRTLADSDLYADMTQQGSLVAFAEVATSESEAVREFATATYQRPVYHDAVIFSVETVSEITYPWEWPNALLAAAGRLTLEFRENLLAEGLDLKDAAAFNVQFRNGKPIFVDIGSVEVWRPNPSWNAGKQFIEHFINPLAVGYTGAVCAADAWSMSRGRGIPSNVARQLMPGKLKRRLGLAILQASTRPVARNKPSEIKYRDVATDDQKLAMRATRSFTSRLRKSLDSLENDVHSTTWADYGNRDHYSDDNLSQKGRLVEAFVDGLRLEEGALVLDVGGNDGMTAIRASRNTGVRCVVLDVDAGALDQLAGQLSELAEPLPITPLIGDITNLTPASGLLHREFSSLPVRIRPRAVICQAVLHHVVITQGVPMPLAVEALAEFGAPLHIEFAEVSDPKVQLLIQQIPNWSGDYSVDSLVMSLKDHFREVTVVGRTAPTRVVIEALEPAEQGDS